MSAPRLTLDHARSFEVPCTWVGAGGPCDAVVTVSLLHGEWFVSASPDGWGALLLHNSEASPWGRWGTFQKADRLTFPTAQEALVAAFATDQIEPIGDQK